MHGRIKTISTEEQKKRQKQAREEKLRVYTAVSARILEKRENGQFDEEALTLTGDVLLSNPNIITFWNFRREILLSMFDNPEKENILGCELTLTEQCLRSDPKSYGTWHQRLWVLENLPDHVWEKELKLCNKMLSLDERNFHCWDYRKIVVQRAKVAPEDEFNFTTEKIESNFSNYSAWHFRSKVLPILFDDPLKKYPIEEKKHKEELELVLNAAFTDPDDQSAWFYQRWLLNLLKYPTKFVWAQATVLKVTIALSRKIRLLDISNSMIVSTDGTAVAGEWQSLSETNHSACWMFEYSIPIMEDQTVLVSSDAKILQDSIEVACNATEQRHLNLDSQCSPDIKITLEDQLKSCTELLELEPDSKWTLLTSIMLMRSLDLISFSDRIFDNLKKLHEVDRLRMGYYTDLASQITMEIALSKEKVNSSFELTNASLHGLHYTQYLGLVTRVNLSGNHIESADLAQLHTLVNCVELYLTDNHITHVLHLPMLRNLVILHIGNNPIENPDRDIEYLSTFPSIDLDAVKNALLIYLPL